jgi:hypothetical protein
MLIPNSNQCNDKIHTSFINFNIKACKMILTTDKRKLEMDVNNVPKHLSHSKSSYRLQTFPAEFEQPSNQSLKDETEVVVLELQG